MKEKDIKEKEIKNKDKKSTKKKTSKSSKSKKKTIELEKFEEIAEKLEEINDKYLRLSAEFDNYRKRTLKEKMDLIKNAGEETIVGILPIIDNFERAIKANEKTEDIKAVNEGVNLIYNNLKGFLNQQGVKEIDAEGKELNVDEHEAITKIPAPSEDLKGKVVEVVEKGYKLNDKIIRFSKVVVGE